MPECETLGLNHMCYMSGLRTVLQEFHGQCLKILRKATVGVETVNVYISERVKMKYILS